MLSDEPFLLSALRVSLCPTIDSLIEKSVLGIENVPDGEGFVLASNHSSFLDPVWLGCAVNRPIRWLATAGLFENPLLGPVLSHLGAIPVDRVSGGNQDAVDECVNLLKQEKVVGIFPEGGRTSDGTLLQGRRGVARIALRSGKPVVPAALTSYGVLPKHERIPNFSESLILSFGSALQWGEKNTDEDSRIYRKITNEIMANISQLLEEARTIQSNRSVTS